MIKITIALLLLLCTGKIGAQIANRLTVNNSSIAVGSPTNFLYVDPISVPPTQIKTSTWDSIKPFRNMRDSIKDRWTKAQSDSRYQLASSTVTLTMVGASLTAGGNTVTIPTNSYTAGYGVVMSGAVPSQTFTADTVSLMYTSKANAALAAINSGMSGKLSNTVSITVNGTTTPVSNNPSFTIPTGSVYSPGSGISISSGSIINTSPHVTSTLVALTGIGVSRIGDTFSITNTAPAVTQTIIGANGLTVTPAANSFTVSRKRQECYTATTNTAGVVSFTFAAFGAVPNIQYTGGFGSGNKETIIPNAAYTTTSCSFYVQLRSDVVGLLPTYSNVSGREVNIIVTEK